MAESAEDNLTILSSWAPKAYHCFAVEFEELEQLKQQHEETEGQAQHELEAKCRAEVDQQIQRDYPDVYPLLSNVSPVQWPAATTPTSPAFASPSGGGSVVKRQKNKQALQQAQAEAVMVTARREALLQQHMQAALAAQDRQPARQLATRYAHQLETTQKQVKAYLEREAHELQRFTSRPLASYALGEVLEAPPVAPAKTAPATVKLPSSPSSPCKRSGAASPSKRDGATGASSCVSRAASERGSARSSRTKKSAGRTIVRSGRGGAAGTAGSRARTHSLGGRKPVAADSGDKAVQRVSSATQPPPFLIDAHQFAVEYNEMLKREYGYRPAMTNTFPSAATDSGNANAKTVRADGSKDDAQEAAAAAPSAAADADAVLREKLRTHIPGQTSKRAMTSSLDSGGGDYSGTGWLPPIHAASQQGLAAAGPPLAPSPNALPLQPADEREKTEAKSQRFAHSSPTPRRPGKTANAMRSEHAVKTNAQAAGPVSTTSNALSGIECAVKGKCLSFATCVGTPARQVVRFVNRNAYRTRLRLKASAHPWLSFRCICIAPAAGSSAATSTSADAVPPETPLNCGGFIEVEVVFCPQSIDAATAVVDAVLEMGVARELNNRQGEGAQWQFMSIPVRGQVILPCFEWWRQTVAESERGGVAGSDSATDILVFSEDGVQSTKSVELLECGRLISHDALPSYATPLRVGSGAGAVEFGHVLVLGRAQETLLLENTGSEAVVHLLSSSPEFVLSLTPDVATTLPSSQAVVLQVTFCPLKEGVCEATLTVAVRASSDSTSAVLSEHIVELRGSGVVPRVRIASLASQVVMQQSAVPQWRVRSSEAPLLTILKDTMPGVPADATVTVCNECAVPLAFHWEGDSDVPQIADYGGSGSGNDGEEARGAVAASQPLADNGVGTTKMATLAARCSITPPSGVLAPFNTSAFVLTVTPATLQPFHTLYNLFLDGMPDPAAADNAEKLSYVDAEVVEFYQRSRPIPCTVQHQGGDLASADGGGEHSSTEPLDALQVSYLDPVTAFSRFRRSAADRTKEDMADKAPLRGVFAASFLTYQQPSLPSLTITPAVVEERVECLLKCPYTRTVTLHNNAPVALYFVLDPTGAEFTASLQQPSFLSNLCELRSLGSAAAPLLTPAASTFERWRGNFPASHGIAAQCQPRKGVIPAHGSVSITVHFTVEACGPHYAVVPCWVPAVEQLRALLLTASAAARTTPVSRSPSLSTHPTSSQGRHYQSQWGGSGGAPLLASFQRLTPPSAPSLHASGDAELGSKRPSERRQLAVTAPGAAGGAVVSAANNTVTALSHSPAEDALRVLEEGGCYAISVTATGVGATVKVSTDLLDFGLIELGQEAPASFTVSNPNSIPVVFDLCDPLMRQPPRFVFIPESFRLGAGNTVEVTVYRKAVSTEDAQTFFELTVRDGGAAIAIETRATIQQPLLVVDVPVVDFGVVAEGVWQTGTFRVSNRSAIDTEFTVAPAVPLPPHIEMEYEKSFLLCAGEQLDVPVRCQFHAVQAPSLLSPLSMSRTKGVFLATHEASSSSKHTQAADNCYSTLLSLISKRSRQTLLVEVRCDAVEKLSISVDVVAEDVQDADADAAAAAAAPPPPPPPSLLSTAAYIRAVLLNALDAALDAHERNQAELTHADTPGATVVSGAPCGTVAGATTTSMIPYCSSAHLVGYMPDDLPLARRAVDVVVQSYTGGEATFTVAAERYAPQPMESVGTQGILDKRKKAAAKAAARSSKGAAGDDGGDNGPAKDDATTVVPPAFWTASVNGGAKAQQAQRQVLQAAQKVLGDGSGCATLLSCVAGVLRSHGTVRIPVQLWCALPGRYVEHLCVRADPTLPLLRVPVEYEVYGRPIVLDATTSGLTKDGGREGEDVLLMPPVIAPLGTSRRTIRLINRVSRDMDVSVEVFPCPLGMAVHALNPDAPADEVELKLLTMNAEDKEREGSRVGHVTATPLQLCIPAHAHREVVLEFTPNAQLSDGDTANDASGAATKAKRRGTANPTVTGPPADQHCCDSHTSDADKDDSSSEGDEEAMLLPSEKWWQGSVCINAVLAQNESNDMFLVDEFYTINAERYPSQRVARPLTGAVQADCAGGGSSSTISSFSATQVKVLRPLRSRPNNRVVRRGRVVWPTEAEQRILDRHAANRAAAVVQLSSSNGGATVNGEVAAASSSDSDDDENDTLADSSAFSAPSQTRKGSEDNGGAAVPSLEVLLREAEERRALLDFIQARRQALQAEGNKYFSSIELRLRARCGRPHLTIEPSEKCLEFPAVAHAVNADAAETCSSSSSSAPRCTRTVRLTNRNSAPLRFALSFAAAAAAAASHKDDSLACSPMLFSIVRCALWQSGHDEAKVVFSSAVNAAYDVVCDACDHVEGNVVDDAHVYTLDSMDALDVVIDAQTRSAAWHQHLEQVESPLSGGVHAVREAVEGLLKVQFLPTSAASTATLGQSAPAQLLPLRVPLTKPSIECRPGVIWFRPGQQRHDGRPQVAYAQTFTLYNASAAAARFHIHPVTAEATEAFKESALNSFRVQQQQLLQHSFMAATVSPAVTRGLVTANTATTTHGVAGADRHHSLTHKVEEVVNMPAAAPPAEGRADLVYVDDPSQFSLSPCEGVLPPASLGGEPGEVKVRVDFREFSNLRYESLFAVVVDGDASVPPAYVVLRGDSRDTEL